MTVEQHSLCWLGGRLAANREGQEWATEFGQLPHVEQVTRDGGQGLRHGLAAVNADRQRNGQPVVADQEDHFHLLHRLRRGLAGVRAKAQAALRKAEQAQEKARRDRRKRKLPGGRWAHVAKCWRQAEQAFDRWSAQEQAMERLRAGLRLFTVAGAAQTIRLARINRKFATTISTIARFPQGGGHESMVAGGSSFGGSKAG